MFGGLSISKRYNNVMLDNRAGTGPETVSRNDLWHWNGDWIRPAWTEQTRQRRPATLWPPPWVAPLGWASDADGGELWLVGDSGTVPVRDESSWEQVGSNAVWRFSMHTETWDRYQLGQAEAAGGSAAAGQQQCQLQGQPQGGPHGQPQGQTTEDPPAYALAGQGGPPQGQGRPNKPHRVKSALDNQFGEANKRW